MNTTTALCARCIRLAAAPAVAACWHSLWRHGWRRFVEMLLDTNADSDPAKFVASLLAVGASLAVLAYAVLGSAGRRALELLFTT